MALFSPSGRTILTSTSNRGMQLWTAPATPEQAEFFRNAYARGSFRQLLAGLLPAGAVLNTQAGGKGPDFADQFPKLWRLSGHELRFLRTPDVSSNLCGAFAPNEEAVFTAGSDRLVRVWKMPAAAEIDSPLEARIVFVSPQVTSGVGQAMIRAELDNPADPTRRLRQGMTVSLTTYPETAAK